MKTASHVAGGGIKAVGSAVGGSNLMGSVSRVTQVAGEAVTLASSVGRGAVSMVASDALNAVGGIAGEHVAHELREGSNVAISHISQEISQMQSTGERGVKLGVSFIGGAARESAEGLKQLATDVGDGAGLVMSGVKAVANNKQLRDVVVSTVRPLGGGAAVREDAGEEEGASAESSGEGGGGEGAQEDPASVELRPFEEWLDACEGGA